MGSDGPVGLLNPRRDGVLRVSNEGWARAFYKAEHARISLKLGGDLVGEPEMRDTVERREKVPGSDYCGVGDHHVGSSGAVLKMVGFGSKPVQPLSKGEA